VEGEWMKKQLNDKEQRVYDRQLDDVLISGVQNGESRSLEKLYQRHQRSVYGLSMGILGSHHDAEEVVQETFLQVWRKCMTYNPSRGAISTWIMTIGRSRALDLVRKRSRLERKSREAALEKPTRAVEVTPEGTVISSQEAGWLHEALDEIGTSLREVISLVYFKGLSHSEISNESALSLGTVKWRIRIGTERLGQVMRGRVRQRKRTPSYRQKLSTSQIRVAG
jgi:RNA polymerase sigma-70 factor (ECF subfamily)